MFWPGSTIDVAVFSIARSEVASIGTVTASPLFDGSGSTFGPSTDAPLTRLPVAESRTLVTTSTVRIAPLGIDVKLQRICGSAEMLQLPLSET
jgi:hypothetical protein